MEFQHIFIPCAALFFFALGTLFICFRDEINTELEDEDPEVNCPICGRVYKGEYAADMLDDHIHSHQED